MVQDTVMTLHEGNVVSRSIRGRHAFDQPATPAVALTIGMPVRGSSILGIRIGPAENVGKGEAAVLTRGQTPEPGGPTDTSATVQPCSPIAAVPVSVHHGLGFAELARGARHCETSRLVWLKEAGINEPGV